MINWVDLVAQIVNFLVLMGLLTYILYKPINRMIDERTEKIKSSLDEAEKVRNDAKNLHNEYQTKLDSAKEEVEVILSRASKQAEESKNMLIEQAKQEAARFTENARKDIALERQEAMLEIRNEVADIVIATTRKIIGQAVDPEAHKNLLNQAIEQLDTLKS